jgi:histone-arginine methyltransferase CARM1
VTGVRAQVAGSDSHVDVVGDEYEPSATEAELGGAGAAATGGDLAARYKAFRLVVTDTHTEQVLLNEYLAASAPYRGVESHFHAFTTTHGFEYGLDFATIADAERLLSAVSAARAHLHRQRAALNLPAVVQTWQHFRECGGGGEAEGGTGLTVTDAPTATAVPTEPSAEGRAAAVGLPQFTRQVEDQYFDYYAAMSNQQLMLEDSVRTLGYWQAFEDNKADFEGKVVVDVGAGSGVLSFFAARAGAARVYAIEASSVAECARALVEANGLADVIQVIHATVEATELPEQADIIISEPMGFMLFHEQMLDSFVLAREKFLRPGGLMFPSTGTLYAAPLSDAEMHAEQSMRAQFWDRQGDGLYGIDVSAMRAIAERSHFASSIVDLVRPTMLPCGMPAAGRTTVDFRTATAADFDVVHVELPPAPVGWREWKAAENSTIAVHGVVCWFDVVFIGTDPEKQYTLSTAPDNPKTHWYQTILPLHTPLLVPLGHEVGGSMRLTRNRRRSYDIVLEMGAEKPPDGDDDDGSTDPVPEDDDEGPEETVTASAAEKKKAKEQASEAATQTSRNVIFLQDMITRYIWSNRIHTYEAAESKGCDPWSY